MKRSVYILVLLAIGMMGCTHNMVLAPQPVDQEFLPKLTFKNSVGVSGEFTQSSDKTKIWSSMGHKWYANSKDLTKCAIKVAEDILKQNNVPISEEAQEHITLSVLDAKAERGWGGPRVNVVLRATVGEQIERQFTGTQKVGSVHNFAWGVEAATTDAVIQMFKDPEIQKYLSVIAPKILPHNSAKITWVVSAC